jgi:hypothetical protein
MSYGPNYLELFRRAGDYVDRILRGRLTCRAANQVRSGRQPGHGEGASPRDAPDAARARRRGDRIIDIPLLRLLRAARGRLCCKSRFALVIKFLRATDAASV